MPEGNTSGNVPKISRSTNIQYICPPPQEELLNWVKNVKNDAKTADKIRDLVKKNENLLTFIYKDCDKNILNIACMEEGIHAKTVLTVLLELGANPRDHSSDGWQAIHWAAWKANYEILKILLNSSDVDVNAKEEHGLNALHILFRYAESISKENLIKCAKLLIEKGIDVYSTDDDNKSSVEYANKAGVGDDIQNIIQKMGNKKSKEMGEILMEYLKKGEEHEFILKLPKGKCEEKLINYNDGWYTLLQKCCKENLIQAAKHLLEIGANFKHDKETLLEWGCKNYRKPIEIVADNGYFEIFEELLKKYKLREIPKGILARILRYVDRIYYDNKKCYKCFIDKLKDNNDDPNEVSLKVNETYDGDDTMNTPLMYAIKYGDENIVLDLLGLGALLGTKNTNKDMPVEKIQPEVLKKHLNQCIDIKKIQGSSTEFVEINYQTLIPPNVQANFIEKNEESGENGAAEMKCFIQPNVQPNFIDNCIINIVPEEHNNKNHRKLVAETEVIFAMSKREEYKHLLNHPVIVIFLYMKWLQMQWLFWTNLGFYITFAVSLAFYIFTEYAFLSKEEKHTALKICVHISYAVLFFTLIVLILREVFQLWVLKLKYFKNFANFMEIILILFTSAIVFGNISSNELRKELSAASVLLAAFNLVLMLGNHPYFSTNVVMLKTVSFNFFRFFLWYSMLIIAFAFSFYLLFTTNSLKPDLKTELENNSSCLNDTDDTSFENPGTSVFKTIIMLTGEFDSGSINFNTFPVTGRLIFSLFIFMIAIILLNLLNGLAVSDTQKIIDDSELVGHITRTKYLRYVETVIVRNYSPDYLFEKLNNIYCCLPIWKKCKVGKKNLASLFSNNLSCKIAILSNNNQVIELCSNHRTGLNSNMVRRNSFVSSSNIYLDQDMVRKTIEFIKARRYQESCSEKRYIQKLQQDLEDIKRSLSIISGSGFWKEHNICSSHEERKNINDNPVV